VENYFKYTIYKPAIERAVDVATKLAKTANVKNPIPIFR